METKFNKKVQKHRRRWFREDWQEKLPVRQVFLFAALLLLVLLILLLAGGPKEKKQHSGKKKGGNSGEDSEKMDG